MNTAVHYHLAGMGQTGQQSSPATTAQMTQIAAGGTATVAAQIIAGNYVGGAGSVLLTAAPFAGPAAPFLAIAGLGRRAPRRHRNRARLRNTCIAATAFANQAEKLLRQNLNTYMGLPVPRYQSQQTAALNIFDQVWASLISPQACGNPALGDAANDASATARREAALTK